MKKLTTFTSRGSIKDGRLVLDNEHHFKGYISLYEDTPKVRIIVEKERGTRTKQQNRYYWGIVLSLIAEHMGERPEDLHEILKSKYLRRKRVWRGGEITILRSTADLTSDEFGEYIDQCIQEGSELGVVIPMPDKEWQVHEQFPDSRTNTHNP